MQIETRAYSGKCLMITMEDRRQLIMPETWKSVINSPVRKRIWPVDDTSCAHKADNRRIYSLDVRFPICNRYIWNIESFWKKGMISYLPKHYNTDRNNDLGRKIPPIQTFGLEAMSIEEVDLFPSTSSSAINISCNENWPCWSDKRVTMHWSQW